MKTKDEERTGKPEGRKRPSNEVRSSSGKKKPAEKKMSWKMKILLELLVGLVAAIVIVVLLILCGMVMPHDKHFDYVEEYVGYKPAEDEVGADCAYHYIAHAFQGVCYVDADEDISEEIANGECDLNIRITGIRSYRSDTSGIFTKYPVLVYKYIKL